MNILQFAKKFDKLTVEQKTETIKRLQSTLDTGKSPSGKIMKEGERNSVEKLRSWCSLNLFVGRELCPPENVLK